ncbi:hypothetical protein BG841_05645 [Marinobacter sp. X15-166B]|nr:hypothetical protein BG841_05645 [Marinobacter sp. X15-166B]
MKIRQPAARAAFRQSDLVDLSERKAVICAHIDNYSSEILEERQHLALKFRWPHTYHHRPVKKQILGFDIRYRPDEGIPDAKGILTSDL